MTSEVGQSNHGTKSGSNDNQRKIYVPTHEESLGSERKSSGSGNQTRVNRQTHLVYSGKQVMERSGGDGLFSPLPSGTNFIGKLSTGIDTREQNQIVRVNLPYDVRHASGGYIPRNSLLLGNATCSADNDKIFIRFNRIIFPDGKEYHVDAQALNSGDYSPGLVGNHHSNTDLRVASSLGLTMISSATDVLTHRSAMGGMNPYAMGGMNQPDATMKNAMLQGASQVTKQEAQRQAGDMQNSAEYVTLFPEADLIVSLLSPFTGEPMK